MNPNANNGMTPKTCFASVPAWSSAMNATPIPTRFCASRGSKSSPYPARNLARARRIALHDLPADPGRFVMRPISLKGYQDGLEPSLHQWAVMVQIGAVEFRESDQAVKIVKSDLAILEGDQAILAQFAQDTVDVNRA